MIITFDEQMEHGQLSPQLVTPPPGEGGMVSTINPILDGFPSMVPTKFSTLHEDN